jgi:hypothetical protein
MLSNLATGGLETIQKEEAILVVAADYFIRILAEE